MDYLSGASLVTGAGHRVGRAMALALAEDGHDVAIHYATSAEAAEEVAHQAEAFGVRAMTVQADLLDRHDIARLVPMVTAQLGPISVLVNNASIFEYDTVRSATPELWDRHMKSNLEAPFFLTQAFAAQVETGRTDAAGLPVASGAVINMIDQRVRKLTPEFATYTLAKAALWTFTQTAAQGLAPDIRVNAIGPGPTLKAARQSEAHFATQQSRTILQRGSSVAGIISALRFILVSHDLTGQLLCIDGGQHLGWQTPDVLGVE